MAILNLSAIKQEDIAAFVNGFKTDYLAGFGFLSLRKPNPERLKDIDSMVAIINFLAQPISIESKDKEIHLRNRKNAMIGMLIYELYKIFNEPSLPFFSNHLYTSTVASKIMKFLGITELSELGKEGGRALTSFENFLKDQKVNSKIQASWRQDITNEVLAAEVHKFQDQMNFQESTVLVSNGLKA